MSDQFYCSRKGGIKIDGELVLFEGSAEKGPWYNAFQFSDVRIEFWLSRGWIVFKKVE